MLSNAATSVIIIWDWDNSSIVLGITYSNSRHPFSPSFTVLSSGAVIMFTVAVALAFWNFYDRIHMLC